MWWDREDELAADPAAKQAYTDGIARGDLPAQPIWASQAIDLINEIPSATDLVAALATQAHDALAQAGSARDQDPNSLSIQSTPNRTSGLAGNR
jgi:nitronate monooxygenase